MKQTVKVQLSDPPLAITVFPNINFYLFGFETGIACSPGWTASLYVAKDDPPASTSQC